MTDKEMTVTNTSITTEKDKDRFVRIRKPNVDIIISSPYEKESLKMMIKEADKLATKHSSNTSDKMYN